MANFTTNENLYKWNPADTKTETITEMANNAVKIDAKFVEVDNALSGKAADARVEATETRITTAETDITNLETGKTDNTGDHLGTWHGLTPELADPGISSVVAQHTVKLDDHTTQLADEAKKRKYAETSIRSKLMAHPTKKILGDFEAGEGWIVGSIPTGGSCALDSTFSYSGKQSLKIVIPPGQFASFTKVLNPVVDLTNKEVGIMSYRPDRNFVVQETFRSSADNGTTVNQWTTPYAPTIANKWFNIDFIPPTGANLTNQNWIRINLSNVGSTTQTVWYDLITYNDKPSYFTGGAVTFIFDGGYDSAIANGKPIMDKYGYKGVSSINGATIGNGQASLQTLRQMQSSGWDISMHSTYDGLSTIDGVPVNDDYNLIYDQIMKNKDILDSNGLKKGSRFLIYYQGKHTEYTTDILEDFVGGVGRSATAGLNSFLQHDAINVRGTMIYTDRSTATLKTMVDEAKAKNLWIVFFVHKVDAVTVNPANDTSIAQFTEMVDYVNTQGLKVVTYSQMYDDILFRY